LITCSELHISGGKLSRLNGRILTWWLGEVLMRGKGDGRREAKKKI
jgi:hypothetical protein